MMAISFIFSAAILFSAICSYSVSDLEIPEFQECVDTACNVPLSHGKTVSSFDSHEPSYLSYAADEEITILGKNSGNKIWLAQSLKTGDRGLISRADVEEKSVISEHTFHRVRTRLLLPNVPALEDTPPSGQAQTPPNGNDGITGRSPSLNQHAPVSNENNQHNLNHPQHSKTTTVNTDETSTKYTSDQDQIVQTCENSNDNNVNNIESNDQRILQVQQQQHRASGNLGSESSIHVNRVPDQHPNQQRGNQHGSSRFQERLISPDDISDHLDKQIPIDRVDIQGDRKVVQIRQGTGHSERGMKQVDPNKNENVPDTTHQQLHGQHEPADVLTKEEVVVETVSGGSRKIQLDVPSSPLPSSQATEADSNSIPTSENTHSAGRYTVEDVEVQNNTPMHTETVEQTRPTDIPPSNQQPDTDHRYMPAEDQIIEKLPLHKENRQQIENVNEIMGEGDYMPEEDRILESLPGHQENQQQIHQQDNVNEAGTENVMEAINVNEAVSSESDEDEVEEEEKDGMAAFYRRLRERDKEEEEDDDEEEDDILGDIFDAKERDSDIDSMRDAKKEEEKAHKLLRTKTGDMGIEEDHVTPEHVFTDAHAKRGVDIRDHKPEDSEKVIREYFSSVDAVIAKDKERSKEEREKWEEELKERKEREPLFGDVGEFNKSEIKTMEEERKKEAIQQSVNRGGGKVKALSIEDEIDEMMGQDELDTNDDALTTDTVGDQLEGTHSASDQYVRDTGHQRQDADDESHEMRDAVSLEQVEETRNAPGETSSDTSNEGVGDSSNTPPDGTVPAQEDTLKPSEGAAGQNLDEHIESPKETVEEAPHNREPAGPNTPETNINQDGVGRDDAMLNHQQNQNDLHQNDGINSEGVVANQGNDGGGDEDEGFGEGDDDAGAPEESGDPNANFDQPQVNQGESDEVNNLDISVSSHKNGVNLEINDGEGNGTVQVEATPSYEVIDGTTLYFDDYEDATPSPDMASDTIALQPTPVPNAPGHGGIHLEPTPPIDSLSSDSHIEGTPSLPDEQPKTQRPLSLPSDPDLDQVKMAEYVKILSKHPQFVGNPERIITELERLIKDPVRRVGFQKSEPYRPHGDTKPESPPMDQKHEELEPVQNQGDATEQVQGDIPTDHQEQVSIDIPPVETKETSSDGSDSATLHHGEQVEKVEEQGPNIVEDVQNQHEVLDHLDSGMPTEEHHQPEIEIPTERDDNDIPITDPISDEPVDTNHDLIAEENNEDGIPTFDDINQNHDQEMQQAPMEDLHVVGQNDADLFFDDPKQVQEESPEDPLGSNQEEDPAGHVEEWHLDADVPHSDSVTNEDVVDRTIEDSGLSDHAKPTLVVASEKFQKEPNQVDHKPEDTVVEADLKHINTVKVDQPPVQEETQPGDSHVNKPEDMVVEADLVEPPPPVQEEVKDINTVEVTQPPVQEKTQPGDSHNNNGGVDEQLTVEIDLDLFKQQQEHADEVFHDDSEEVHPPGPASVNSPPHGSVDTKAKREDLKQRKPTIRDEPEPVRRGRFNRRFTRTFGEDDDDDGVTVEIEEENEIDFTQRENSTSVFTVIDDFVSSTVESVWPMIVGLHHFCAPAIELLPEGMQAVLHSDLLGIPWSVVLLLQVAAIVFTFFVFTCCFCGNRQTKALLIAHRQELETVEGQCRDTKDALDMNTTMWRKSHMELTQIKKNYTNMEKENKQLLAIRADLERKQDASVIKLDHERNKYDQIQADLSESQKKINEYEESREGMKRENSELLQKIQELEESSQDVDEANKELKQENDKIYQENQELLGSSKMMNENLTSLNERLNEIQEKLELQEEMNKELDTKVNDKTNEIEVLKDCLVQMKGNQTDEDGTEVDNEQHVRQLLDTSRVNAKNALMEKELEKLQKDLDAAMTQIREHELKQSADQHTMEALRQENKKMKYEKEESTTKLSVLQEYFKNKEIDMQRKIGVEEAQRLQTDSQLKKETDSKASILAERSSLLKKNKDLQEEMEKTEKLHKDEVQAYDKKAHEAWLAVRAAERQVKELERENAGLRHKLTDLESSLDFASSRGGPSPFHPPGPPSRRGPSRNSMQHTPPPMDSPPPIFDGPPPPRGPPPPHHYDDRYTPSPPRMDFGPPPHPGTPSPPPFGRRGSSPGFRGPPPPHMDDPRYGGPRYGDPMRGPEPFHGDGMRPGSRGPRPPFDGPPGPPFDGPPGRPPFDGPRPPYDGPPFDGPRPPFDGPPFDGPPPFGPHGPPGMRGPPPPGPHGFPPGPPHGFPPGPPPPHMRGGPPPRRGGPRTSSPLEDQQQHPSGSQSQHQA
ncbi:uncharacterized protein [Amphiura filiformis]|uniref:uncharacterized protein isoform X1 n=1 Tax=Amphiura filiformis TaxID=82378 RepID=UPI003B223953